MQRNLRIILSGQRSFGLAVLRMLRELPHTIVAVYAPLGDKLHADAVAAGHPVNPGGHLSSKTMPDADLLIAAHSHDFISRPVRNRLALGAIGYHPSLLTLHRGRDAVEWTIRMRDRITGGTVYWLNDTVDGGPICKQDYCLIHPSDTASTLWRDQLFPMGLRLLRAALNEISNGVLTQLDQDHTLATWEPSLTTAPRLHRPELHQLGPFPGNFTIQKEAPTPPR
jgi:methionyl-tRNA formyltransferase